MTKSRIDVVGGHAPGPGAETVGDDGRPPHLLLLCSRDGQVFLADLAAIGAHARHIAVTGGKATAAREGVHAAIAPHQR